VANHARFHLERDQEFRVALNAVVAMANGQSLGIVEGRAHRFAGGVSQGMGGHRSRTG
jgi:hypothetical protein